MIIIRALYVLKSSGVVWRAMLDDTLTDLDYKPARADMYVWMNTKTNKKLAKSTMPLYLHMCIIDPYSSRSRNIHERVEMCF